MWLKILNLTWRNIKLLLLLAPLSWQVQAQQLDFVRKLYAHQLITSEHTQGIEMVIRDLCAKTRFKEQLNINRGYDAQKLNFYIIDSRKDTVLKDICAFAGANIIILDQYFLTTYLDRLGLHPGPASYRNFQYWVIGHEIAHADLDHSSGHFLNNEKPKTQEQARHLQFLELQADQKSLSYWPLTVRKTIPSDLIAIFNAAYRKQYGPAKTSNKYLLCDPAPYLTYAYRLQANHPVMVIRTSLMLYLLKVSPQLNAEAFGFLQQSQLRIIEDLNGQPIRR
ncbi:hypothetical protein ACFGVR_15170 [Mucilaginibacter sp. AW1-3]